MKGLVEHRWTLRTALSVAFIGFFGGLGWQLLKNQANAPLFTPTVEGGETLYNLTYDGTSGEELAFVYIGSSTCGPSNHEDLPRQVEELKQAVKAAAEAQGMSLQRYWRGSRLAAGRRRRTPSGFRGV